MNTFEQVSVLATRSDVTVRSHTLGGLGLGNPCTVRSHVRGRVGSRPWGVSVHGENITFPQLRERQKKRKNPRNYTTNHFSFSLVSTQCDVTILLIVH